MLSFEDARGLFFVLITFLSISLSIISFIVHPAPLITIDPTKKSKNNLIEVSCETEFIQTPQKHGHISKNAPYKLLYLPKI